MWGAGRDGADAPNAATARPRQPGALAVGGEGEAEHEASLPPELAGVELLAVPYGSEQVGVIEDRREGTFTAALAVRAGAFAMRDGAEQERALDAWGAVLASCARDGSPIRRLQWLEQTVPGQGDELAAHFQAQRDRAVPLDSEVVRSYIELVESAAPQTTEHEVLIALQIDQRRGARELRRLGGGVEAACELLLREAESLAERLTIAEVSVSGLLRPRQYAALIRDAFDPFGRQARTRATLGQDGREGVEPALMGPLADESSWSTYRTDSAFHATYWIASWPRSDVGPMFMAPLLMQTSALRTVAVTIEPVPYSLAMRRAEAAQTAEVAEEINRSRQGFMSTARIRRRQQAASRREEELADGHAEMRWAGYVRTSARSPEELERAESRGRARRAARPPRPATPLRRAGHRLSLHPAALPGTAVRRRAGERPGHGGTTAHFQSVYPFLGQGGLGAPGAYIGRDAYGGAWMYDPWALYPVHLPGPNMLMLGGIASRKSSLVKTYIYRQAVFGRQAWVLDIKGEYWPLAKALGVRPITLAPGGEVRLNPLSPRGGREGPLSLLRSVAQAALRRELSPEEDAGLRVALEVVDEESGAAEPTLPMVVDALLHPREAMVQGVSAASARGFRRGESLLGAGPATALRGRPAGHVRRADERGTRPRRAAGRARPERRPRLGGAGDPDDLRRGLAAGDPLGAKARRRAGGPREPEADLGGRGGLASDQPHRRRRVASGQLQALPLARRAEHRRRPSPHRPRRLR